MGLDSWIYENESNYDKAKEDGYEIIDANESLT